MSKVTVIFYREEEGEIPVLEWLAGLPRKAQAKCLVRIERLQQSGHELRRPEADLLRDKIYELRIDLQGIHYRILYFFCGKTVAVLAHSILKEREIPPVEIERAIQRSQKFIQDPKKHTHEETVHETQTE